MDLKAWICSAVGAVGGAVAALFGGWSFGLTALLILMGIDYLSGLVVAGVFHSSPKTPNGRLESHAGLKGLLRKVFVLCVVVVAQLTDRLLGTAYLRDAVTIAFCLNETISVLENAGLMGVPLPKALTKALEVLKQKAGEVESGKLKVKSEGTGERIATSPSAPRNDTGEAGPMRASAPETKGRGSGKWKVESGK